MTHGFPQNPSPVFHSTVFTIENRPGLEDQRIEGVLRTLNDKRAPDVGDSRHDGDTPRRFELAKWLSDWHLIAFLGTSGLVSEVRRPLPLVVHVYVCCIADTQSPYRTT